jgi:hypothetical protein
MHPRNRYTEARRIGDDLRWRGVIVGGDARAFIWTCDHAHLTTPAARACARVELEDMERAERRSRLTVLR